MEYHGQDHIGESLNAITDIETTPRQPTGLELAYMAGLFDGEGYVCIWFDPEYVSNGQRRSEAAAYRLTVGITMTNEPIIRWIHGFWSGSHKVTKSLTPSPNWASAWHWRVSGRKAEVFLRAIYPLLRVKKQQVAIAFKFLQVRSQKIWKGTHREDELKAICNKLRSLNAKGKKGWDAVETERLAPVDADGMKFQSELSSDGKNDVGNDTIA